MDEEAGRRRSRGLAIVAFLLAITSMLLGWWRVTWSSGGSSLQDDVRLFRPEEPLTTSWGPWLTGVLVALAIVVLFVRIAARSEKHEPASWRRDVGLCATLLAVALLSCMLWPEGVPAFWGGRTLQDANVTNDVQVEEVAMPGLGWWIALVAVVLLLAARLLSKAGREPTTDK